MTSNSEHRFSSRRPLLLTLPTPCLPMTPFHMWWFVPTLALKSPSRATLSLGGTVRRVERRLSLKRSLDDLSDVGVGAQTLRRVMWRPLARGMRSIISLSSVATGVSGSRWRREVRIARPMPWIRGESAGRPFHPLQWVILRRLVLFHSEQQCLYCICVVQRQLVQCGEQVCGRSPNPLVFVRSRLQNGKGAW